MKILYIVQQSVYNNDNKWSSADSNINMTIGSIKSLIDKTDWEFYVLLAPIEDFCDIKKYSNLLNHKQVHYIDWKRPVDAFLNRNHFDVFEFDRIIKSLPNIDVIWNNIVELSRNIKTYLFFKNPKIKLISGCYWLDSPYLDIQNKIDRSISYEPRQFDGFACSDLLSFTCMSTKNAFIENAKKKYKNEFVDEIINKSTVWDFGYSQKELDFYYTKERFEKKTILFLNRMSPTNYTRHIEFIDAVNLLYEQRRDFQVIFTNPSQKISWDWLKKEVKPIYIYSEKILNRKEYVRLLWKSGISIHLYTKELYGGCSNREAIYTNNIVITPKVYEYFSIQRDDYPFYVKKDLTNLIEILNKALDSNFIETKHHLEIKKRNTNSSYEVVSKRIIEDIDKLMQEKNLTKEKNNYVFRK